jgi:tRNA A-37 threonylcarbamoyl transferase component Bud32
VSQFENDGVRWELQPGFAPLLKEVLNSPGEVVKESPAKLVTMHKAAGRTFYIKRYRHASVPFRPLKFFVKASQARQEWTLARQLESLGVPVVAHLALGERWGLGLQESLLITEGFAGKPLEQMFHPNPPAVVEFVRRMHERGVLQEDLHGGNILVSASGEMRLVDLHGTIIKPSLTAEERAGNLARLRVSFPLPVPAEVEALSVRMRRQLLRSRSRRCLRRNREFSPERAGGLTWWVRLPFLSQAVKEILNDPDGLLRNRAQILKGGRTSTVGRVDGVVLKRFNLRKMESLVKDLFRASRARRAFRAAYHLELLGLPTARPIAAADRRVCGLLLRSYLLMEEIVGATHLGAYLREGRAPEMKAVEQAARLIARLHEEGFSHRDLKESNLVLGADGRLYLLDLDGMNFFSTVPDVRAAADLQRLAHAMKQYGGVTPAHRARVLRVYCRTRNRMRVPRLN